MDKPPKPLKDKYVHRNITGNTIDVMTEDVFTLRGIHRSVTFIGKTQKIIVDGKEIPLESAR